MGTVRSTASTSKALVGGRWTILFLATATLAAAASLVEGGSNSPLLNAALTTAQPILAFSTAYLLYLRFGRTRQWSDLLLHHVVTILGFVLVFFHPFAGIEPDGFEVSRAPLLTCYYIAAMTLAGAVLFQGSRARNKVGLVLSSTVLAAAIPLVVLALVPHPVSAAGGSGIAMMQDTAAHPAGAGVVYALLVTAGAGFSWIRRRSPDPFYGWLTVASAIAAFALAPPFIGAARAGYTEVNDILVFTFLLLLYLGAQREMALQRELCSNKAVKDERLRLARELHDGVTQELVFIASQGNTLLKRTHNGADEGLRQITSAAERAADEARQSILILTRPNPGTTGEAAGELARELASRSGVDLALDVDPEIELSRSASNELLGILREAIANAARHGQARKVSVGLHRENGIVLEISDDGRGFDPGELEKRGRAGFGLVSMQQRAHVLGGSLQVWSSLGQGTKIRLETSAGAAAALT